MGILSGAILLTGAPVVAGIVLWKFAERIVDFGRGSHVDEDSVSIASADLISAGTYLIGVYVLVFAFVSAVNTELSSLLKPVLDSGVPDSSDGLDSQAITRRVSYALRIVIGISLMKIGRRSQIQRPSNNSD